MKRRCSLAMALTANPKIVFLDEPSSGLDPVKRRHFWSLVKKVTEQRAVLLTTHLMEEADTLCSEIGILTSGKMRCVGNSIYLKKTFTQGIKIQVVLESEICSTEEFMKKIQSKLKGVKLLSEFQGTLILTVKDEHSLTGSNKSSSDQNQESRLFKSSDNTSNSAQSESEDEDNLSEQKNHGNKLSNIFKTMSQLINQKSESLVDGAEDGRPIVKDWSISLGSLEDVFLNVVRSYRENNIEKLVF